MSGNSLALSSDLNVITAEINSYKQVAGQSLFEIGKRLKHVKENDLAHGQFGSWVESLGFNSKHAYKYIQAYEQFSPTSGNLSTSKILEMLSLPESVDREQFVKETHTVPSTGESKTVDEMTVKELREVKKALQESERKAARAQQEAERLTHQAHHFEALWNQEKRKPAQIVVKEVEKVPDDYDRILNDHQRLNNENVALQRKLQEAQQEFSEKITNRDEQNNAVRKLRESFKNILSIVNQEHYNAKFYHDQIHGSPQAHEAVTSFLTEFGNLLNEVFPEWKNRIQL